MATSSPKGCTDDVATKHHKNAPNTGSLTGALYDGPNESKEQKKGKQPQQPNDQFQGAAKNLEGALGNLLGDQAQSRKEDHGNPFSGLVKGLADEVNKIEGALAKNLKSATHDQNNANLQNARTLANDVGKSNDGADDDVAMGPPRHQSIEGDRAAGVITHAIETSVDHGDSPGHAKLAAAESDKEL